MIEVDTAAVDALLADYRAATGDDTAVEGAFAFGDSEAMADELAQLVLTGPKRATAGAIAEFEAEGEPLPEPGQLWVVHDGRGRPVCIIRTTETRRGALAEIVDPAFAWDEGEDDRTHEGWLAGHTAYWTRGLPSIGASFSADLDVLLQRFELVWPAPGGPPLLASDGDVEVRALATDERTWAAAVLADRWGGVVAAHGELTDPSTLPGLIAHRDGDPVGLLTFRPRPGVDTEVVTVDALQAGLGVGTLLLKGVEQLARRAGWRRLWLVTTNDNLQSLRIQQRAGWRLVGLDVEAVDRARELKPTIPRTGRDGIPLREELELELPL
ncbi:hypothetical protein BH23ACT9_BH23ACT9_07460 [soil metagenome]